MAKQITLREYEFLQYKDNLQKNYINQKTFEELEQFALENDIAEYLKITTKKGFGKVLQAQNYVGVIQTKPYSQREIFCRV